MLVKGGAPEKVCNTCYDKYQAYGKQESMKEKKPGNLSQSTTSLSQSSVGQTDRSKRDIFDQQQLLEGKEVQEEGAINANDNFGFEIIDDFGSEEEKPAPPEPAAPQNPPAPQPQQRKYSSTLSKSYTPATRPSSSHVAPSKPLPRLPPQGTAPSPAVPSKPRSQTQVAAKSPASRPVPAPRSGSYSQSTNAQPAKTTQANRPPPVPTRGAYTSHSATTSSTKPVATTRTTYSSTANKPPVPARSEHKPPVPKFVYLKLRE